jgi:mono/diheme cytochrome c family protein
MRSDQNDYNKAGFTVFLISMVTTITFFIYISFVHKGVDLKEIKEQEAPAPAAQPQAAQESAAPAAPQKIADINSVKEPWISTPELGEHGKSLYMTNCSMCHGEKGMGDGPAGASLNPAPRNFVEGKWKLAGDSIGLFKTITSGISGTSMAAYGHLAPGDRWALVHFIRSITQNKVADDEAKLKAEAPALK